MAVVVTEHVSSSFASRTIISVTRESLLTLFALSISFSVGMAVYFGSVSTLC